MSIVFLICVLIALWLRPHVKASTNVGVLGASIVFLVWGAVTLGLAAAALCAEGYL